MSCGASKPWWSWWTSLPRSCESCPLSWLTSSAEEELRALRGTISSFNVGMRLLGGACAGPAWRAAAQQAKWLLPALLEFRGCLFEKKKKEVHPEERAAISGCSFLRSPVLLFQGVRGSKTTVFDHHSDKLEAGSLEECLYRHGSGRSQAQDQKGGKATGDKGHCADCARLTNLWLRVAWLRLCLAV